jgi:hypothetical protein
MFFSGKHRAAVAVALVYFVVVPVESHSQDWRVAGHLAVAGSGMKPGQEPASSCAIENEIVAPIPNRILLAGESCESLPPNVRANGFCGGRGAPAGTCMDEEERVLGQLLAMGKRGETIAHVRAQVLEILQSRNACAAWFQEVDADPAGTFRSLEFFVDENGPLYVHSRRDNQGGQLLKQPYVASAFENAGRHARIQLNANGAFFNRSSKVFEEDPRGALVQPRGIHTLSIASYSGNTPAAQIATLIHELGHIVGRIPEDNDSWDGLSARNTAEVLHFCRPEINAVARRGHH